MKGARGARHGARGWTGPARVLTSDVTSLLTTPTVPDLPVFSQPITDPGFVQNPYPFYDRARAAGALVFWSEYGLPCATRHAAINALLRDRRLGRQPPSDRGPASAHMAPFAALQADSILELEPPRQRRLRGLLQTTITPAQVAAQAPVIEALAGSLIEAFPRQGEFDLVAAFTAALPARVILHVMGLQEVTVADLERWSSAMVRVYQAGHDRADEHAASDAASCFAAAIDRAIAAHRAQPRARMLDALIAAGDAGEGLSHAELVSNSVLMLNAAREATVHALGNAVKTLLEEGEAAERAAWLALGQIEETVEECLRFEPPLHLFTRHVYEPVEVMGHRLEPGSEVICLLGAAGRDPAQLEDPHRFDPFRPAKPHLAFSAGVHFCLGAGLARLELKLALQALFARCPRLRLVATPRYADSFHFRGPEALMVRID